MLSIVTGECTGIPASIVGDWLTRVRRDDVGIEVDHPLSRHAYGGCTHPMCCVARRAREAIVDVASVLAEAGIGNDIVQIMALRAKRIRARARIGTTPRIKNRIREKVQNRGPGPTQRWGCDLAELIAALQDVRVFRTVGAVCAGSTEFPTVLTVVAIGTEDPSTYRAILRPAVLVPHDLEQARLWQTSSAITHNRMRGTRSVIKLRNQVKRIASGDNAGRGISHGGQRLFAGTLTMAT